MWSLGLHSTLKAKVRPVSPNAFDLGNREQMFEKNCLDCLYELIYFIKRPNLARLGYALNLKNGMIVFPIYMASKETKPVFENGLFCLFSSFLQTVNNCSIKVAGDCIRTQ